jgi:uncharacterized protein (DUF1330 family)
MSKGYVMARIDVTDPEEYGRYVARTRTIAESVGGRFLVRAGRHEQLEGQGRTRHVLLEFPDFATARAFYRSEPYQAILPHALAGSERELVLVEGVDEETA